MSEMSNQEVASRLREAARRLDDEGANPFRVRAYGRAADTVESRELYAGSPRDDRRDERRAR